MAKKATINSLMILHLIVAMFLILTGINGLIAYSSKSSEIARAFVQFFGGKPDATTLVIGIIELTAGIVLVLALFMPMKSRLPYLASLVICVLWALHIVYILFVQGAVEQNAVVWLRSLSLNLIVLMALWMVSERLKG